MQFISIWNQVTFLTALIAGLVVSSATAQESGGKPLRWKLADGDRLEIAMEQTSSTRTQVDRRQVDQSSQMALTLDWLVESVDEQGTATIRQTITAIRCELTLPGAKGPVTTIFDSAEEKHSGDARQLATSFSGILKQPVTLTMTARGEIQSVDIPDETLESMRQMPGSMEGREVFSIDSLREMFQSAGTEFPETPVAAGQSWLVKRAFQIGSPHQFTRETTYTLEDDGKINFDSSLVINSNVGTNEDPDVEFYTWRIGSQESGGQINFDFENGYVTNSQSTMRLETKTTYQSFAVSTIVDSCADDDGEQEIN